MWPIKIARKVTTGFVVAPPVGFPLTFDGRDNRSVASDWYSYTPRKNTLFGIDPREFARIAFLSVSILFRVQAEREKYVFHPCFAPLPPQRAILSRSAQNNDAMTFQQLLSEKKIRIDQKK